MGLRALCVFAPPPFGGGANSIGLAVNMHKKPINQPVAFKTCSACGYVWLTWRNFLDDPELVLLGYQVDFDKLETGLFLFNHVRANCGTTLSLKVAEFRHLYNGPVFRERLTGSAGCLGYCLKRDVFKVCPNQCECAYVREILNIISHWPKQK